jgi:hypothetical protein
VSFRARSFAVTDQLLIPIFLHSFFYEEGQNCPNVDYDVYIPAGKTAADLDKVSLQRVLRFSGVIQDRGT